MARRRGRAATGGPSGGPRQCPPLRGRWPSRSGSAPRCRRCTPAAPPCTASARRQVRAATLSSQRFLQEPAGPGTAAAECWMRQFGDAEPCCTRCFSPGRLEGVQTIASLLLHCTSWGQAAGTCSADPAHAFLPKQARARCRAASRRACSRRRGCRCRRCPSARAPSTWRTPPRGPPGAPPSPGGCRPSSCSSARQLARCGPPAARCPSTCRAQARRCPVQSGRAHLPCRDVWSVQQHAATLAALASMLTCRRLAM